MLPPLPHPRRRILQFSGPRRELHNMVVFLWPYSLPGELWSLPALPLPWNPVSHKGFLPGPPVYQNSFWSLGFCKCSSLPRLLFSPLCHRVVVMPSPPGGLLDYWGLTISTLYAAYFYNMYILTPLTSREMHLYIAPVVIDILTVLCIYSIAVKLMT